MISFNKATNTFRLDTTNSTYCITIAAKGYVAHSYYGPKIGNDDTTYLLRQMEYPFADSPTFREKLSLLDFLHQEMPTDGVGDFRKTALAVTNSSGNNAIELKYTGYKIVDGCPTLTGLPCVFDKTNKAQTLIITTKDEILGVDVELYYTVFDDTDAIVRSSKIISHAAEPVYIKKAMSLAFDMDNDNYDAITLNGSWGRERHLDRHTINMGTLEACSIRGVTSHQEHPFLAILDKTAGNDNGKVYGVNFIYSGNFSAVIQRNQFDSLRVLMGINPENFCWKLEPGAAFETPQAVLVFSNNGLNGMSHAFHDLYRNHLIRSPYKNQMRPVLINNWEATYFNFDTQKLLDIAREAHKDGIEMLVMDDGWFGKRDFDDNSLGDWIVYEKKLQGGLKNLVDQVNALGMKFGIWFEPEMVSKDSELLRAHPDWAIQIKGREPGMARAQFVLDITRKEVRDYIMDSVEKILHSANIEYVKWDMNRQVCDVGSIDLPADQIGEYFHRYVLAVYEMQERLITSFPNLLLENCSSGGARFDPGMFYYSPQIWCSDNTDATERLFIQEGTAIVYPLSTMGAHVSVCPNHAIGRVTPFKTRGYVALSGTFGYELDITKLSAEDRAMVPQQVALYKKFSPLVREGDYYRIASAAQTVDYDCWASISRDKTRALVTFVQLYNRANYKTRMVKIPGLDANRTYTITWPDEDQKKFPPMTLTGATIMNAGIPIRRDWGDYQGQLIYLEG
ncbi:MAG: alpha-galactosidase [Treponema sp.]|nr:alpha-galactosidase [Treponema sp.]